MKILPFITRNTLAAFMIYMIFKEAGIWTAGFVVLATVQFEAAGWYMRTQREINDMMMEMIKIHHRMNFD